MWSAVIVRVFCGLCAVFALGLVLDVASGLYLTGFPDGHLTDYDKAVDRPEHLLLWAQAGFGLLFVALTLIPMRNRTRTIAAVLAAVGLLGSGRCTGSAFRGISALTSVSTMESAAECGLTVR